MSISDERIAEIERGDLRYHPWILVEVQALIARLRRTEAALASAYEVIGQLLQRIDPIELESRDE